MTKKTKDVMEEALHALISVKKNQALRGGPYFTSDASRRDAERRVNRAIKLLREELQ